MRGERELGAMLAIVASVAMGASCSSSNQQADAGGTTGNVDAQPFDVAVDGAPPRPGTVKMAVPAYFAPPSAEWQRLIAGAPEVGMIVFNPDSGPGTGADQGYTQVIAQAQAAGIIMLGYVATSYGARPEAEVIADINHYYDFYALSGIYFAEGPMDADCAGMEAMYHRMSDAVRVRDSRAYLAVGTRFCPTYIFFFDLMVQFARNWAEYQTDYTPPSWMPANSPQRFVHFVNSVPASDASAALSRVIANGAGWVFITDQSDPNPWGVLPSYFDQEMATMRAVQ
jgi:spherulation-specific family 4 protein